LYHERDAEGTSLKKSAPLCGRTVTRKRERKGHLRRRKVVFLAKTRRVKNRSGAPCEKAEKLVCCLPPKDSNSPHAEGGEVGTHKNPKKKRTGPLGGEKIGKPRRTAFWEGRTGLQKKTAEQLA